MPARAQLQQPLLRAITIKENGTVLPNVIVTLFNGTNNGTIRGITNSRGVITFDLAGMSIAGSTVSYTDEDTIYIVVGGIDSQSRVRVRRD